MKRVRMLQTRELTQQFQQFRYEAGKTFLLPDPLAKTFIERSWAMEDKSLDAAPEKKKRGRKKKTV